MILTELREDYRLLLTVLVERGTVTSSVAERDGRRAQGPASRALILFARLQHVRGKSEHSLRLTHTRLGQIGAFATHTPRPRRPQRGRRLRQGVHHALDLHGAADLRRGPRSIPPNGSRATMCFCGCTRTGKNWLVDRMRARESGKTGR